MLQVVNDYNSNKVFLHNGCDLPFSESDAFVAVFTMAEHVDLEELVHLEQTSATPLTPSQAIL